MDSQLRKHAQGTGSAAGAARIPHLSVYTAQEAQQEERWQQPAVRRTACGPSAPAGSGGIWAALPLVTTTLGSRPPICSLRAAHEATGADGNCGACCACWCRCRPLPENRRPVCLYCRLEYRGLGSGPALHAAHSPAAAAGPAPAPAWRRIFFACPGATFSSRPSGSTAGMSATQLQLGMQQHSGTDRLYKRELTRAGHTASFAQRERGAVSRERSRVCRMKQARWIIQG